MRGDNRGEATLARRLSPLGVWALSLGCIIGWGSFIMPGTMFLPHAGPAGTAIAMFVAAAVMIVIARNYSYLIEKHPVAGGEFAYIRSSFGTTHAFACSWLLGLCYLALVAQNATALALVVRNLVGGVFQVGFHYTFAGYDVYLGELALALCALVLFAALSVRGVRFTGVFQTVLVLAIVCGVAVAAVAALGALGPAALAPRPAFNPGVEPVAGVLAVLAIAPFAFVGFDTVPQAAEEYHFPSSRTRVLVASSILFGALVYVALTVLASSVVAPGYADWPSYVSHLADESGVRALPTFNAAYTVAGPAGLAVLAAAATGAILSGIVGFYMATSRLLFALGRDGVLPKWFSAVHPRFRTPHHAILFVLAVSAIAPFFGRNVLGWLVDMSSLGAAVAYGYTSAVALRSAAREGRRAIVATGALGVAFSVLFAVLLLVPLPGIGASMGFESYICLAVWVMVGIIFYITRNRRGADGESERQA